MREILYIGFGWLLYVYCGYPFILAMIAVGRRVRPQVNDRMLPNVSVLIAARNEEKDIGWKIAETLSWDYPPDALEVLVASDASDDSTDDVIRHIPSERITFVRMNRRGGKVRALNRLARLARGEVLFFTDANAHIGAQALRRMIRHFADERVGAVTGDSRPIGENEIGGISKGSGVYWGYETILKRLENLIGSVLVCDGAIFCARASLFQDLNPNLANDLETPMRIGSAGYLVLHEPDALVFERDTTSPLEEFRRRRRMCSQGMLALFTLPNALRGLRGWQIISHKFLRWLSLVPMLAILISSAALAKYSITLKFLLGVQVLSYVLAGAGFLLSSLRRSMPKIVALPFYVVLGSFGALVGVTDAFAGRKFDVWNVAVESRGQAGLRVSQRNDGD